MRLIDSQTSEKKVFFQGITVYIDERGYWRMVMATGDRSVVHPFRFDSRERALRIAQAAFPAYALRVLPFPSTDPASAPSLRA
jgi:hypothetical protein